jgi:hypothetical protein
VCSERFAVEADAFTMKHPTLSSALGERLAAVGGEGISLARSHTNSS